ncbi:MAG: sigma-70 family RNA polymerase sigma factor [Dehalococcoidia bacterium]|nr:sigma-70 family RNA polymerase sigma factor [Dehalococcoidia bacterium]
MRDDEVSSDDQAADGRDATASLARRASAHDPAAWEEIFDRNWHPVFAFVRFRLRGAAEAEDIAAHVFEVAYARAAHFDYRGVPIEAWLIGIARNLVRDYVKKRGRRGFEEELVDALAPGEPDAAAAVDLREDLRAAMQTLTDDQQAVLSLRFLLDKSVADTARLMERSEDAVKNLQRRALAAMHRALAGAAYPAGRAS